MGKAEETVQNGFTNGHKQYSMEEVKKHCKADDKWIVIKNKVYDITNFARKHPGGARIISHYAGQDATVSILNNYALSRDCIGVYR